MSDNPRTPTPNSDPSTIEELTSQIRDDLAHLSVNDHNHSTELKAILHNIDNVVDALYSLDEATEELNATHHRVIQSILMRLESLGRRVLEPESSERSALPSDTGEGEGKEEDQPVAEEAESYTAESHGADVGSQDRAVDTTGGEGTAGSEVADKHDDSEVEPSRPVAAMQQKLFADNDAGTSSSAAGARADVQGEQRRTL